MIKSHLDYCSSVWSPYRKGDIEDLEKVQKRATKSLPQLKHLKYSERLRACKLPTLHYRRIRGDMIETFKILTGKYDSSAIPVMQGADCSVTSISLRLRLRPVGLNTAGHRRTLQDITGQPKIDTIL